MKRELILADGFLNANIQKKHYDEFIGESDFAAVSSWGIDHVRIPIDYDLIENGNGDIQESGMMYIQQCIDWCKKYRLNMILDLHKTYGFFLSMRVNLKVIF